MSYYMGDYYQGDYYYGDPLLGGLAVAGLGWVGKKVLGKGIKAAGTAVVKRAGTILARGTTAKVMTGAATGAAVARMSATPAPPSMMIAAPAPPGYIPKKGLKGKLQRLLPGGETGFVKRRRMNVANPRALRRAIRRAEGFRKLAMRVLSFSKGRSYGGRVVKFKRAR